MMDETIYSETPLNKMINISEKFSVEDYNFRLINGTTEYTIFCTKGKEIIKDKTFNWDITPIELDDSQFSQEKEDLKRIDELEGFLEETIPEDLIIKDERYIQKRSVRLGLIRSLADETNTEFYNIDNELVIAYLHDLNEKLDGTLSKELEDQIKEVLNRHKNPSAKLLAEYLNTKGDFYFDNETQKRYWRKENSFHEITRNDLTQYLSRIFGYNQFNLDLINTVFKYLNRNIKTDYDLITFKNGTLNTKTEKFEPDKYYKDRLTKLVLPFDYLEKPAYEDTLLADEIEAILTPVRKGWDLNNTVFYKAVGSLFTAVNETDKMFILVGKPGARKSTLLTIIKRIFENNYSEVKLQTIAKNERFGLIPTLRKAVNLDDDLQGFRIDEIGFLNSFVSGMGGNIELKGENTPAQLTPETTPRIFGASNKLPSINGDGFERRNCLILCENDFSKENSDKRYMMRILNGERDEEISHLISYCIQLYFNTRNQPFTTAEQDKTMLDEWEWKSYPAKKCAEWLFLHPDEYVEDLKENNKYFNYYEDHWEISYDVFVDNEPETINIKKYVAVNEVNTLFRKFHRWALKNGYIFKEHKIPSTKVIKSAMSGAGYSQTTKKDNTTTIRVYDDCILNPKWKEILNYNEKTYIN